MNNITTELCKLAYKYGTDKCPQIKHSYTPFYYELLKNRRRSIKKVLEIGIGPYKGRRYNKSGASLYMWRDFFPSAQIYGADNRPQTLFEDARIKTYLCDERIKDDLVKLIGNIGSDIDIFVDDGSHELRDQIFTCLTLMPLLQKNVIYIIEDVTFSKKLVKALNEYECWIPQISKLGGNDQLVIVKNRQFQDD